MQKTEARERRERKPEPARREEDEEPLNEERDLHGSLWMRSF